VRWWHPRQIGSHVARYSTGQLTLGALSAQLMPKSRREMMPTRRRGLSAGPRDRDALSRRLREVDYRIARQTTLDAFEHDARYGCVQRRAEFGKFAEQGPNFVCIIKRLTVKFGGDRHRSFDTCQHGR
jgi:hypothetical protein